MAALRAIALVVVTSVWSPSHCKLEPIPMPGGMEDCFHRYSMKTNIVETVGESIASFCVDQYIWMASKQHSWRGFNVTREAYDWAHSLLRRDDLRRVKRQALPGNQRVRREYRRLTDQERAAFHRAIQLLKTDTTILPNRYDALSAIHQGIVSTAAHGGPNFLAFHRVYILMFENALREKVASVTLPYWDSTLDEPLRDPTQSIVFSETFLGDGQGLVNTGPFAHWNTLSGPLTRNIGHSGQLFKAQDMNHIINRGRLAGITEPLAPVNSSLEFLHNQVHLWIDGQMGSLNTASHDPVFWLHHAYVDYVWELFRMNQRNFGIDPTRDYPMMVNNSMHMPGMPMGISNFRNIDGFSDMFTSRLYTYEPSPTCSQMFPDCGTPYLRCIVRGFRATCVSQDWRAAPRAAPVFRMFTRQPVNVAPRAFSFMGNQVTRQMAPTLTIGPRHGMQQQILRQMALQEGQLKELENGGEDPAEPQLVRRKRRSGMGVAYKNVNPGGTIYQPQPFNVRFAPRPFDKNSMHHQTPFPLGNQPVRNNQFSSPRPLPMCPTVPTSAGYQNTFNINGRSDIHQWVYIPVKIIYQRPPTYKVYTSFPVVNGEAEEESDIYSPIRYKNVNSVLQMGKPASYSHCKSSSAAGKVYVASKGINYMGTYKEYAIVDHRLAISVATAYVAVKSPERGLTEVFLSAYDECGRVCQAYCRSRLDSSFQRCPGTLRLSSELPKMYGTNFGDAMSNLWTLKMGNDQCPSIANDVINVQFHCNFKEYWPFLATQQNPNVNNVPSSRGSPVEVGDAKLSREAPGETDVMENKNAGFCNIGHGCFVSGVCKKCQHGKMYACARTCTDYATCRDGVYYIQSCPENTWFDQDEQKCRPGSCFQNNRTASNWPFLMQGRK